MNKRASLPQDTARGKKETPYKLTRTVSLYFYVGNITQQYLQNHDKSTLRSIMRETSNPCCHGHVCQPKVSFDKHRVAIAKETVFFFDRDPVHAQDILSVIQRRNQHQKRGLWQMEVRNQRVDNLKLVSGIDKDSC